MAVETNKKMIFNSIFIKKLKKIAFKRIPHFYLTVLSNFAMSGVIFLIVLASSTKNIDTDNFYFPTIVWIVAVPVFIYNGIWIVKAIFILTSYWIIYFKIRKNKIVSKKILKLMLIVFKITFENDMAREAKLVEEKYLNVLYSSNKND